MPKAVKMKVRNMTRDMGTNSSVRPKRAAMEGAQNQRKT